MMFLCFYSARHCQFVATMAFIRRFCTSSGMGYHRTTKHISRGQTGTSHLGHPDHKPLISIAISVDKEPGSCSQHVYFSKLRPSTSEEETGAYDLAQRDDRVCQSCQPASATGRSHSLHWDRRETSLMCLEDSAHCYSAVSCPSDALPCQKGILNDEHCELDDMTIREPPVLFSIERGTVSHVLSMLTATLPVQEGLKEVTATLRRLSASMHVQSVLETAAKPWNEECSDDIIIRHNRPIRGYSSDDVTDNQPIRHHGINHTCQPSNHLGNAARRHLYFNKVYHVPMVAAVPELSHLQSSADDCQPASSRADPSPAPEQETSVSPQDNGDRRPSKEQILTMYQRLVDEMPNFLNQSHDFSMYASTVEFDNRIMKFKTKGLPAYRASVQGLKYLCAAYVTGSTMEVLRITTELEQGQIQARWRVRGVPLHSYVIRPWQRKHPDRYFDAFSTFELGTDGLIHRHKLDKVMPTPPDKVRVPSLATRIGVALGLVRNPALSPNCMVPKPLSFMQPKTSTGKL